jgi:hypothetical protein
MKQLLITALLFLGILSTAGAQQASNGLFVLPTAYTLPKGTHSVSSYELILMQYSYSLTNTTHISAFSMFPFTAEAFTSSLAIGVKQQLYKNDVVAFAATTSYLPESQVFSVMGLASVGSPDGAVHFGVGKGGTLEVEGSGFLIMLGGEKKTSARLSVMAEFLTSSETIDSEFKGLFSGGARYRTSEGLTIDFGIMRPVTTVDLGGFLALPLLKATYEF